MLEGPAAGAEANGLFDDTEEVEGRLLAGRRFVVEGF